MEYNTVEIYNDIQTIQPRYENFGDNLYWAWACWQMLWTYGNMGKSSFDKVFYMMRSKRFKQYQNGEFEIHDLYELNKGKLRMGDYCCYCGAEVPKEELTADHVFPRAKGGSNDLNNIIFVCKNCNSSKGKKELLERFLLTRKKFPRPFVLGHYYRQIYLYAKENDLLNKTFVEVELMVLPFNPRSLLFMHTKAVHRAYFDYIINYYNEN